MINYSKSVVPFLLLIVACQFSSVALLLDQEFTYKATVECSDGTGSPTVGKTNSIELYSAEGARGVVKLLVHNERRRLEYHYDANLDVWLEVFPQENSCISSSQYDMHLHLYQSALFPRMDQIYRSICPECVHDAEPTRHLIGTAKLLLLVQKLRPKFGRPIEVSTRHGSHLSVYHLADLRVDDSGSVDLFVHYNRILDATSRSSDQVQPQLVRLHYKAKDRLESHTIGVTFYQFELLTDTALGRHEAERIQHPFALPTGMHCSRALGSALARDKQQPEVQTIRDQFKHLRRLSFSTRDLDYPSTIGETFYALDLSAKLMRKDYSLGGLQSTTIYDIKDNTKYNIMVATSKSQRPTECIRNKIMDSSKSILASNEAFINFEQLVYLGKARVNSVEALIFEEYSTRYGSSYLQFWIRPPVWASPLDPKGLPFRADEIRAGQIYVTYYFASGLQSASASSGGRSGLGPLMLVEITVRDALPRVLWRKRLMVADFVAGRLVGSHLQLDSAQMFSLTQNCELGSKTGQVNAILQSNTKLDHDHTASIGTDPNERNELLIEALGRDYAIRRTQIDQLSSRLLAGNGEKLVLEFELTMSGAIEPSRLGSVDCIYLGRGLLLGYDSPNARNYTGVATFEDCLWLAHQHLYRPGASDEQVLFVYTDYRVECFVDRLYRHRSLNGHEAVLAGSNTTLSPSYFPYEYGPERIYTIKKKTVQSSSKEQRNIEAQLAPIGMHLLQADSLKTMGKSLDLRLSSSSRDTLSCQFQRVTLSGCLAQASGVDSPSKSIAGLGWSERDANRSQLIKALDGGPEYLSPFARGGQMSEAVCQSRCLLDTSCNSYSFCSRVGTRAARCLLSSIDVGKAIVMKQLENLKDNMNYGGKNKEASRRRRATIMFDEGSLQQPEVEVVLDWACAITAKSHADLFRQNYPVQVDGATLDSIDRSVADKEGCAKKCLAKNADHWDRVASLSRPIGGVGADYQGAWESIVDSARELSTNLCTSFLYTNDISTGSHGCLIISNNKGYNNNSKAHEDKMGPISMIQHGLVHRNLFRRMAGLRLLTDPELQDKSEVQAPNYEKLLQFYLRGSNGQIRLPMDDAEFCARACVMQVHGPRPLCSSFDFMQERQGNTTIKYCLLNSQSLYDLQNRSLTWEQQVLREEQINVSFWHFEPRYAAPPHGTHHSPQLIKLRKIHSSETRKTSTGQGWPLAFMSISLILKFVGLVSGLVMGVKFTGHIMKALDKIDEPPGTKGRTTRLIHRLSGVSLSSNLRESEVQMS